MNFIQKGFRFQVRGCDMSAVAQCHRLSKKVIGHVVKQKHKVVQLTREKEQSVGLPRAKVERDCIL